MLDDSRSTLRQLPAVLRLAGYADFIASHLRFGCDLRRMTLSRDLVPVHLLPLLDLFLFGGTIAIVDLPRALTGLIPDLAELGILELDSDQVRSTGLSLLPVLGIWLFSQQTVSSPSIYLGDDSLGLLQRLTPLPGDSVLDLCAGPGIQSLHCARRGVKVHSVEINPAAVAVARLNIAMNGLEAELTSHLGDLYAPVQGQRFELIIANPPLVPIPDSAPFPFVGHGGADGFRVTRRILAGLPDALAPGGSAQIIGTCLSDGIRPDALDLVAEALPKGLEALLTITAHVPCQPGDWQFEMLANTPMGSGSADSSLRDQLAEMLKAARASHLAYFYLRITEGARGVCLMDLSNDLRMHNPWYV